MSLSEIVDNLYNYGKKALITTLIATQLCCGTAYANKNNTSSVLSNSILSDRNNTLFTINRELPKQNNTITINQNSGNSVQISPNFNPYSETNYSLEIKTKSILPQKINDSWIAIGIKDAKIKEPEFSYKYSENDSYRNINKKLKGNSITNFLEDIILDIVYSIPNIGDIVSTTIQLQNEELSKNKDEIIKTLINYKMFEDYNIWICQLPPIIGGYSSIKMDLPIERNSKDRHMLISIYTKNQQNDSISKTKKDHLFLLYEDGKFQEKDLLESQFMYKLPNFYNVEFYNKSPESKLSNLPNHNITVYE